MVLVLGDLDLPVRGRTYLEPGGMHVAIARGAQAALALEHAAARPDCLGVALVGPAPAAAGGAMEVLAGRRLLLVDGDGARVRDLAGAALDAGVEVEWAVQAGVPVDRLAAWALPAAGIVLARPGPGGDPFRSVGGRPSAMHAVEAAREGGCHLAIAVCSDGQGAGMLRGEVEVVLEARDEGAGVIAPCVEALPAWVAGVVVLRGDRVLAGPRTVATLLRHWRAEHAPPAVALGDRIHGWAAPVVMDRSLVAELLPPAAGRGLPFDLPDGTLGTSGGEAAGGADGGGSVLRLARGRGRR